MFTFKMLAALQPSSPSSVTSAFPLYQTSAGVNALAGPRYSNANHQNMAAPAALTVPSISKAVLRTTSPRGSLSYLSRPPSRFEAQKNDDPDFFEKLIASSFAPSEETHSTGTIPRRVCPFASVSHVFQSANLCDLDQGSHAASSTSCSDGPSTPRDDPIGLPGLVEHDGLSHATSVDLEDLAFAVPYILAYDGFPPISTTPSPIGKPKAGPTSTTDHPKKFYFALIDDDEEDEEEERELMGRFQSNKEEPPIQPLRRITASRSLVRQECVSFYSRT